MGKGSNTQAFFALLRAGLWEQDVDLHEHGDIDYSQILHLAQEQSVVGLVAAGLEWVKDVKVSQAMALTFAGEVLQLEQRNRAMNDFIAKLIKKLRQSDVYCLLVKGQGVAQCYEKPLWRSCGDVDLLLSSDNYNVAKAVLLPLASSVEVENQQASHLGMTISGWTVELHGSLRSTINHRMDKVIDEVQNNVFYNGNVRSWENGDTIVFLPSPDNDVFFVFTHILKHFFRGGIGLRQICDWCRLLWTYRDSFDVRLLEYRLKRAGLMKEWRAFGAFAVDWLGMPSESMPLYSSKANWSKKAVRIKDFVMEVGNFGHNRDLSYYGSKPFITRKTISFKRRISDMRRHVRIFPVNSLRFFREIIVKGMKALWT